MKKPETYAATSLQSRELVDHARMREMNLALLLSYLWEHRTASRSQLAQMTGLTKATVSGLVKELIRRNFIREIGQQRASTLGRPSIELELNPEAGYLIGAEIGVDFVTAVLTDFSTQIIWRSRLDTTALHGDQAAVLERMTELVALAEAEAYARSRTVLGLGLGVPGLVDDANGTLLYAPNLKWENVPLRQIFAKRFSFPVTIDNEANLSALGESYFGAAKADTFVLFVSSGVGLGGGIVLDKQLLQSADGFTGEIGHMTMHPDGPLCACGNSGCWEMFASQKAVFRFVIEAMEGGKSTRLVSLIQAGQPLSIPAVLEAARDGDEVGLDALNRAGRWLGVGIANLVNALNPQVVVFGGILSTASDLILPVIRREVEQRALYWSRQNLRIERAQHGLDSCSLGGVAAIYHRILSQPNLGVVPALPVVEP